MQLRKSGGKLEAHKTSIDVVHGLDSFSVFQVSEQVANILQESSNFLTQDYWYLAIRKSHEGEQIEWQITVHDSSLQLPIKGTVEFLNELPTLT